MPKPTPCPDCVACARAYMAAQVATMERFGHLRKPVDPERLEKAVADSATWAHRFHGRARD